MKKVHELSMMEKDTFGMNYSKIGFCEHEKKWRKIRAATYLGKEYSIFSSALRNTV
jgi:hypothetical protein